LALVASALLQVTPATPDVQVDCEEALRSQLAVELRGRGRAKADPLAGFYAARHHAPLFVGCPGPLPLAHSLVEALRDSASAGLSPAAYQPEKLAALLAGVSPSPRPLARLELRLARTALLHAEHRLRGRVSPRSVDRRWQLTARKAEAVSLLVALAGGAPLGEALAALDPPHEGFRRLREALAIYRAIAAQGGWPTVPRGAPLKPGQRGPRVRALRERLAASGDLTGGAVPPNDPSAAPADSYDGTLAEAVRAFQRRHGIEPDGVAGGATLAALNVPVEARLRQILVNLERWRWLPDELGARRVEVNLPGYELRAIAEGRSVLQMRVVIGQPERPSPLMSDLLTGLVLNPTWHLPRRIAAEKLLSHAPEDPAWVRRHGYELWTREGRLDPETVDWAALAGTRLPFSVRQRPGPGNALGQLRFELTNRLSVLLHATPEQKGFARSHRALSNGCVRLEQPLWLAEFAMGDDAWSAERIEREIAAGRTQAVKLAAPLPVHLLYWTSEVDDAGRVRFLADPYRLDRDLARRLERIDREWAR
jgi:murein L,D-transpeptidase YcbB/YkuD